MNNNRQTKNLCFSTDRFKSLQLFFINVLAKYFQSFCLRKRRIFFQRVITLTFLKQNLDVLLILMEMMKYYRRILMLLLLSFMFLCWFVSLPRLQFWNKDCLNGQLIENPAKPVHPLSKNEPYFHRIFHIRKECKKQKQTVSFSYLKKSFKYTDNAKVIMCETPKVASTTWQLLLLRLSGYTRNFTDHLLKKWAFSSIPNKNFDNFWSKNQICIRLQTYTTFMLVRHPFERLVSAYYDKLSSRSTYDYYKKTIGISIAKMQATTHMHGLMPENWSEDAVKEMKEFHELDSKKQDEIISYLKIIESGEITFEQFVKNLLWEFKRASEFDIHWRPQVSLCQPCLFNYSYVIKFENVVDESNRLLEYIQKNKTAGKIEFPAKSKPATRSALTEKTFKLISEEDVDKLRKIYEDDFRIFDYDPYLYHGY